MKQLSHNSPSPGISKKWSAFFCAFNITGDIKSLVQISILLNKSKIVEIWTKFFLSRAILKAQKRQTTFWKWQDKGYFVIIVSRNLLLKLGWQINAANYIKNQDDIQVMFRGTPCSSNSLNMVQGYKDTGVRKLEIVASVQFLCAPDW